MSGCTTILGARPGEATVRFLYFYLMKDHQDRIRVIAPDHAAYWRGLGLHRYLGGPFVDRSGGLIRFDGDSREDVERLVARDPFLQEGLLQEHWVKEWAAEPPHA
jgi:uncharacterized protein YciI